MDARGLECVVQVCADNRTIQIIIQDDTLSKNIIQWRSSSKCFLPKFGSQSNMDNTKKYRDCFTLMVQPGSTIGIVKAYIQQEKQIPFKKQELLNKYGEVLSDNETLRSLQIKKGSTLILRYTSVTQISMKMLMMCSIVKDPSSLSRTMQIIIHDDTYKDMIGRDDAKDCRMSYTLMVAPDDTIIAVKAYIEEQTGLSFKNQNLLLNEGTILRDSQTLISLRMKKGSTLILQYAPTSNFKFKNCIFMVQHDDTIGDIKAILQEKTGLRFHKQKLIYNGKILTNDSQRYVDLDY